MPPLISDTRARMTQGADHLTLEGAGGGVGDFEKKFPASVCWKKKIACSTNDIEKNSCTAASKKKNVAKLFHRALQNPSITATIQWLIFDETPFLHQDLFKVFFPLDGMSSQKAQFCL